MLTVETLRQYGADVDQALARCAQNEGLYLTLVRYALNEPYAAALGEALRAGDLNTAFDEAHRLKGTMGNLSLTPVFEPAAELTELLRRRSPGDYAGLYARITERLDALRALLD